MARQSKRKTSIIGKAVESIATGIARRGALILPLVEKAASFLPVMQIEMKTHAVDRGDGFRRHFSVQHRNLLVQALVEARLGIVALQDSARRKQLDENFDQLFFPPLAALAECLEHIAVAVAVHD